MFNPFSVDRSFLRGWCVTLLLSASVCAGVKGIGRMDFDVDSNGSVEMSIQSSGLALSGNLYAGKLLIGSHSDTSANLGVSGSFSQSSAWVGTSSVWPDHDLVFADTSSRSIVLTLPSASQIVGRKCSVKKVSANNLLAMKASDNIEGNYSYFVMEKAGSLPSLGQAAFISDGSTWRVLDSSQGQLVGSVSSYEQLKLWLDASDNSTVHRGASDNVYQWDDKSGNNQHATQGTAALQMTYTASDSRAGGRPSVGSTVRTDKHFVNVGSVSVTSIFIVTAYKTGVETTFDDYECLLSCPNGVNGAYRIMGSQGNSIWNSLDSFSRASFKNASSSYSFTVLPLPLSLLRFEGSITQSWSIGANDGGFVDRTWPGPLCEVMFFNGTLTHGQRQILEGYLAWKWGIESSLPAGHLFKDVAP